MNSLIMTAGFILLVLLALGLTLILRTTDRSEKIMVSQFLATVSIGWLLLQGALTENSFLFDVALLFAILATLATVAFVRHGKGRIPEKGEGDEPR